LRPLLDQGAARYSLVLNDDTELGAGSVAELVRYADADPCTGVVGPRALWPSGTPQPLLYTFPTPARSALSAVFKNYETCRVIPDGHGWLGGACLLLRVSALASVGLFDDRFFMFFEDVDLSTRLARAGWKIDVCPSAEIVHTGHATVSRHGISFPMECQMLRSEFLYYSKYFGLAAATAWSYVRRSLLIVRAATLFVGALSDRNP